MGCNCGRKRVIRRPPPSSVGVTSDQAQAMVASASVNEIDTSSNVTDPATGVSPSAR